MRCLQRALLGFRFGVGGLQRGPQREFGIQQQPGKAVRFLRGHFHLCPCEVRPEANDYQFSLKVNRNHHVRLLHVATLTFGLRERNRPFCLVPAGGNA